LALTVIYLSIYRIGRTSVEEKLAAWREPKSEADVAHVRANSNSACRGIPLPRVLAVPAAGCDTRRYPAGSRSTSKGLRSLASCRVACRESTALACLFITISGCIALERVVLRVTAKLHYRIVASLRCCARRRSSDSCLGRFRACRGAQRSHSCAAFTQTTAVRARACVRECVCACVCVSGVSGSRRRRRPSTTLC
jgi:hypothetical protein